MSGWPKWACRHLPVLAGLVAMVTLVSATPAPAGRGSARAARMASMVAGLRAELTRSGAGTWNRWFQRLAPVRAEFGRAAQGSRRGRNGFVLNRNAVDYLQDADLEAGAGGTRPVDVLVSFSQQLRKKGIDFIYVPIPAIEEVYPENHLTAVPSDRIVQPLGRQLLLTLLERDVDVVDLLPVFHAAGQGYQLGLKEDDHWNYRQLELAAAHVAERLRRSGAGPNAAGPATRYRTRPITIAGERGISAMNQVVGPDGRLYDDVERGPVLVVGDSNLQVYQYANADVRNAGEHAGFTAHLARGLNAPVSLVASGGFTPAVLNRERRVFEGRRVVIFVGSVVVLSRIPWPPAVVN